MTWGNRQETLRKPPLESSQELRVQIASDTEEKKPGCGMEEHIKRGEESSK